MWFNDPIRVKLSDFGLSWGNILQSSASLRTHTSLINVGTHPYKPPEILNNEVTKMNIEQLKQADVWGLGITLHKVLNPSTGMPYFEKYKNEDINKYLEDLPQLTKKSPPEDKLAYESLQSTKWQNVYLAYQSCLQVNPVERETLVNIKTILERKTVEECHNFPLQFHQGSAFEDNPFCSNDGTNSCTFLALKIAENVCSNIVTPESLVYEAGRIIQDFPRQLNNHRDKNDTYEVHRAYECLYNVNLINDFNLINHCSVVRALSKDGRQELVTLLEKKEGVHIVTVPPYTCVLAFVDGKWCIIDTHRITESLGGMNGAIVKVFSDVKSTSCWFWRRLVESGVKHAVLEIIQVLKSHVENSVSSDQDGELNSFRLSASTEDPDSVSDKNNLHNLSDSANSCSNESEIIVLSARETVTSPPVSMNIKNNNQIPCSTTSQTEKTWYGIPFLSDYKSKLSNLECIQLVTSNYTRTAKIPKACRRNAVFLISSNNIEHIDDIGVEDKNGAFTIIKENRWLTAEITFNDNVPVGISVARKKAPLTSEDQFHMKIKRKENEFGLGRSITYFITTQSQVLNQTVILQYYINTTVAGDVTEIEFEVKPHGNSKNENQFHPTPRSVRDQILNSVMTSQKTKTQDIYDQLKNNKDNAPRNRKQIINISGGLLREIRSGECDVTNLLAYHKEMGEDSCIIHHSEIPDDVWVLATKEMIYHLKSLGRVMPLSIDPTFNFGKMEVTPMTYRLDHVEGKSKNSRDQISKKIMIGPTILQHRKIEATYYRAFSDIARICELEYADVGIITDGEENLFKAIRKAFKEATPVRCTRHFQQNVRDYLVSLGFEENTEKFINLFAIVFGDHGLIHSLDKKDLNNRLMENKTLIANIENVAADESMFYKFLLEREEEVLGHLIQDVRQKAGLPLDSAGIPVLAYTNQSETSNSVLLAQKIHYGYGKKEDISKTEFVKNVWIPVINRQREEIHDALFGCSERYQLTDDAKYLKVNPDMYCNWREEDKIKYAKKFDEFTLEDLRKNKQIPRPQISPSSDFNRNSPITSLSVRLHLTLPHISYARLIEDRALELLNNPSGIFPSPSLEAPTTTRTFCVAGTAPGKVYQVNVGMNFPHKITCNCDGFNYSQVCKHSVAVAEKENLLPSFCLNVKNLSRKTIQDGTHRGSGRKGGKQRKRRFYKAAHPNGKKKEKTDHPFTEVWHNNEPFIVCKVEDIPAEKCSCETCGMPFPRGVLSCIPYDLVLSHKECWKYPKKVCQNASNTREAGEVELCSTKRKKTTKYYCVNKECIFSRFPYFQPSLIEVPSNIVLDKTHEERFEQQLGAKL